MSKIFKLSTVVSATVLLAACANTYLPEAHTYANGIKNEMMRYGVCNNSTCATQVLMKGSGWRIKSWQGGSISLKVLGVNSQQLVQAIVKSRTDTRAKMPKNLPVSLELYAAKELDKNTDSIDAEIIDEE